MNWVLSTGRNVGAADVEGNDVPFAELAALQAKLNVRFADAEKLTSAILKKFAGVSADG
ncbi:MAG: hypothetical protein Q8M31_22900 [Beijerinckiaceae bacterium]|nr:hypothetical protein [Beijerinckiaceae bacterium]